MSETHIGTGPYLHETSDLVEQLDQSPPVTREELQ